MEMARESRIALDRAVHAPHPCRVNDKTDQAKPPAPKPGKDAKLAAALRANLSRRKAAARQAATAPTHKQSKEP